VLRKTLCLVFLLSSAATVFSSTLKVTVVDPNGQPVAGAHVTLAEPNTAAVRASQVTAGSGEVSLTDLSGKEYTLQVLAAGFAASSQTVKVAGDGSVKVELKLTAVNQTVMVTATRSPLPLQTTGASTTALDGEQLQAMQPVSAGESLRFVTGAVVSDTGQRGGLTSLFVRGGDSRYNKVIIDDVPVNDPGGTFNFGVVPMAEVDRLEMLRGSQSTLYGSDAMTSVVQLWSNTGSSRTPELTFGADGGNYYTAHGFAALAGAISRFDYDLFADQFNTEGQSVNDEYSNSLQGANLGVVFTPETSFRLRVRHSNARTGVPGEWNFNGNPYLAPDEEQRARNNDLLASGELQTVFSRWQHRFTGYEYNEQRYNIDSTPAGSDCFNFGIRCPFLDQLSLNRAGFDYQGQYLPRTWAHSDFGFEFEDENGFLRENFSGDPVDLGTQVHGLRRNYALYGQQFLSWKRISFVGGLRYVNNESFGEKVVPHAALVITALEGGEMIGATRFRFAYGTGIKAPRFEESFGLGSLADPNPDLKPEENRALEGGLEQDFDSGRYTVSAVYYNNLFTNQITFVTIDPVTFEGKYENLNRALAHGAELELKARPTARLNLSAGYTYTSTQILRSNNCDAFFSATTCPGLPLLRRPKHLGSVLATYTQTRWGGSLGGSFVGRRPDSDFLFCSILGCGVPAQDHTAGYARIDLGGWWRLNHYVTAYANLENALNKHYEDVSGYPAPRINFRAGFRFRIGGD